MDGEETKEINLTFKLAKMAKGKGCDNYVCVSIPTCNIYLPQDMTRNSETEEVSQTFKISIRKE